MSYNGSGTFVVNSAGQPVVTGTVISSTAFNALTADLATGLSTAVTKDGQTTTTARVPFAQGISSTLVTDATSSTTGSIISSGGISCQKALFTGGNITASAAGAIQIIAKSTVNSTYPTMYLKANNRSWWTSALDTGTDAPLAFGIGAVPGTNELMRLTPTGLLGIGGTPSTQALNVFGTSVSTTSSNPCGIRFYDNGYSTASQIVNRAGQMQYNANSHVFLEADTEVARFDTSGNLLVNKTTSLAGNAKFQVTGSDANYTTVINDGTATNGCQLIRFDSAGGGIGAITNGANVSVVYNTTSDKNLKTLVGTRDNGNLFDLVEWNEFTWIKAPQIGVQVGVFAQDIQKLIPNVVAEGRGVLGDEDYEAWQVNYTGLVPYLGAEVKSLRARVATLEARLTALETK